MGKKSATPTDNQLFATDSDPLDDTHHIWIDDITYIFDCIDCFATIWDDDCYLNIPKDMDEDNPLDMDTFKEQHVLDTELQDCVKKYPDRYMTKRIGTVNDIICYVKPGDAETNWKIALP